MADEEENFDAELEALDGQDTDKAQPDDELEAGADATEHAGEQQQGSDKPGVEGQEGIKPGRAEGRISRLSAELRELREASGRTAQEAQQLRQQLQQLQAPKPQETPAQRQERLAGMTTEERLTYLLQESDTRNQQNLAQMQFVTNDTNDRNEYARVSEADPRAKKYAPEVENLLQAFRNNNMNPKREALYHYLLGQKVAKAKGVPTKGQAAGVARRQAAQETRPQQSGGDVGRPRAGKSLEQRLADVSI